MGGKAAKERRRLARLAAANEKAGQSSTPPSNNSHNTTKLSPPQSIDRYDRHGNKKNHFPSQLRPPPHGNHAGGARHHHGTRPNFVNKHAQGNSRHEPRATANLKALKIEKKKSKVKKPKHLKRKIEKLSAEGNEEERQKLVEELEMFDARKAALSKPVTKRPKSNIAQVNKRNEPPKPAVRENVSVVSQDEQVEQESSEKDAADTDNLNTKDVATTDDTASPAQPIPVDMNDLKAQNTTNDDYDSDSDSLHDATKRHRGRRRRGRKSTEEHVKTLANESQPVPESATALKRTPTKIQIPSDSPDNEEKKNKSDPAKKTSRKDDNRRCIGRKPVTEFVVGQRYPGKVVYTKPFGAFLDVGCHSDAFCHVSRVQDDYVESIDDVLSIGQEVNARIVEVDRKAKRLTVSLQSDARIQDERASVEARKERKEKLGKRKRPASEGPAHVENVAAATLPTPTIPSKEQITTPVAPQPPMDESMMTPAELKRARKLARRAARREQQAQTGLNA